jgi:ribose transport system substrate-binding protein
MPVRDEIAEVTRKRFLTRTAAAAGGVTAALAGLTASPALAADMLMDRARQAKPLKAAFSNAGLQVSWCAQGKAAAEYWGAHYNVEVTWFDGRLDAAKQRQAIAEMADQSWDFVAIQACSMGTLMAPVQKMIAKGIPVIGLDTLIAPPHTIDVHSFIAPDNDLMGATVTQTLVDALGGRGTMVMTWGAYGHSGAQGRARGFHSVVKKCPEVKVLAEETANWDVAQATRLWEDWLARFPKIDAAFFHNDDMALAAYDVIQRHGRAGEMLLGGVDATPAGIRAVLDGTMLATVRNPSRRIHGGAIVAGVAAVVNGEKTGPGRIAGVMPTGVVARGPLVTAANAADMLRM